MASNSGDHGTACTLEFAVQMTCQSCVDAVRKSLQGVAGIQGVEVQLENQTVLLQTTLPSQEVQALLEGTGRQAVLKGMGSDLLPVGTTLTLMERLTGARRTLTGTGETSETSTRMLTAEPSSG
uniref:Copper chaperone for superoxide dismutase n=1 Tax=Rousettus aegyptiacus TaxID=9407 RepID=A0A7J8GWV5_ROUAE|nr:copper chaperone for superoxide dismutase [Rousettus aegyptiacus]